jgi:2-polyprenyl-6-methoxyphenol hydroxylase-like FAD-dependent oxidoreductase
LVAIARGFRGFRDRSQRFIKPSNAWMGTTGGGLMPDMRDTDVAIVGGGLAGSTAAAMLGRAGIRAVLVDPHPTYPPDFRCEKLDASQVALLHKTGLAGQVLRATTADEEICVARFGRLIDRRPNAQCGFLYDTLVNTVRAEIPSTSGFVAGKVSTIATSPDRQTLTLSTGDSISARLVVLANGLNLALRHQLGIGREVLSACHSISIGFNLAPVGRRSFDFRALTYFPERVADRMAYLTLFPIGAALRANLFVYRDLHDPWLRQMKTAPQEALQALMPGLQRLTGDTDVSDVKIRPVDLVVSTNYRHAGIVLAGDAFATSCPAAGTGCNKVLTDIELLCNHHIPRWLESDGMGADKIAAFYDDPVKVACEAFCRDKAFFLRALSTETGVLWRARRLMRFVGGAGVGAVRRLRALVGSVSREPASAAVDAAPSLTHWKQ